MLETIINNTHYRQIILDGVETNYGVSRCGVVINFKFKRVLNTGVTQMGYKRVCLHLGRHTQKQPLLHRIIATAFIPNPNNHPVVNHKDGDKLNNRISNLEWCTQQYNTEHRSGRLCIITTPDGSEVEITNIIKYCRANDLDDSAMSRVAKGVSKQHKGYRMAYLTPSRIKPRHTTGYIVTTPEDIDVNVDNLKGYCRDKGLGYSSMQRIVEGRQHVHKGFKVRKI